MTPDQVERMAQHARRILAERDAGGKVPKAGIEWAEWILKFPPKAIGPAIDDEPEPETKR